MKDSTLYKILGVIILIFFIFLAWKIFIFPKTVQASGSNVPQEPAQVTENSIENQQTNLFDENELIENEINNTTNQVADQGTQTSQSTNVFNSQLDQYKGTHKGAEVRNMLESVRNSNLLEDVYRISVEYNGETYISNVYELKEKIENSKTYEVRFQYRDNTQYIEKIIIEQKP